MQFDHNNPKNPNTSNWHGVDFHHPIHSLQNTHPAIYVGVLLSIFLLYIVIFATIADIVASR